MCRYAVLESWNSLLTCQSDRRRVAPISDSVSCSAFLTTADLSRFANALICADIKKPLSVVTLKEAVKIKLAATYSPAGVQYHRRGWA